MHHRSFLLIALSTLSLFAVNAQDVKADVASQVDNLLAAMTLEEKVGQMTQVDFSVIGSAGDSRNSEEIDPAKLERAIIDYHVGSIMNTPFTPENRAQSLEVWRQIHRTIAAATAKTRLRIPVIYGVDAVHGAGYIKDATLFPQAISMAATFNPDLSYQAGEITARELRVAGLQWNFSPVLDIGRQPLWPRLWETYGEDVHLAKVMGARYIEGHQGGDFSAPGKAMNCLKHYVGYSLPFNGKDRTPAMLGERTLREYFLPPFAAGIAAGAPTIMVNSAEVDGIPGHANRQYLTNILRGELGFKGFTVSDWEDIKQLHTRDKLAASPKEAVKIAVMAGVDMSMVPFDFSFYDDLLQLVKDGDVPVSRIDEAVRRILTVKIQGGLFKIPPDFLSAEKHFASAEAAAVNRQAARESIVLAKNENKLLPLPKNAKILVTGPTANMLSVMNGGWTYSWQGDAEALYPKTKATVFGALKKRASGTITQISGSRFDEPYDLTRVTAEAKMHDLVLLCLGEKPYTETLGNIVSLDLDARQTALADAVFAAGKPVILLMLGGRPRIITPIAEKASAVLLGFLPGMEGGEAVAEILYGDYNPDGKLPITYPRLANDIMTYDHKPVESFQLNRYDPLYPFGFGLSYSTFATGNLTVDKNRIKAQENINIGVDVKNTGDLAGKETVLVYLTDHAASVSRPNKQLKAFRKVFLEPGESRHLTFTLTPDDYAFVGVDMKTVVEPGDFTVSVGNNKAQFSIVP